MKTIKALIISARMTTKNKGDWLYGKIKARIKVPSAGGTWPAFWMMPTNSVYGGWPHSGEMDIMEHYGCNDGEVSATVHNTMYNWNGEFLQYQIYLIQRQLLIFMNMKWSGLKMS